MAGLTISTIANCCDGDLMQCGKDGTSTAASVYDVAHGGTNPDPDKRMPWIAL